MFIVTLLSGSLATRLKENAKQSAHTAYRTKILFETNQLLQKEQDENAVITATAGQLMKLLKKDIVVYLSDGKELATPNVFRAVNSIQEDLISENEKAVADWVFRNNKHAGATTDTLSSAKCLYLAIRVNQHVYGVAGIAVNGIPLDSFENSVLLSILGECALALENIKNAKEKEEAAVLAQNEQLRANLLRAISHDLRTPLTAISGSADNLLANYKKMDDALREQTFTDIYDDSMWLINLVENLLAVTRIEGGQVNLTRSIELMDEVVSEALKHINRKSKEHTIRVTSGKDFILAHIDAKLIVQVIINLVDNAIKYTPVGSVIEIHTPIIVISARSEDNDKVHALDAGADDYLTNPFSVEELLARLRVTQRRLSLMTAEMFTASSVFVNGKLKVDYAGGCAYLDENELHLTPIEYKLLCLLSKNVGKVLTHTFITLNIWGRSWDNDVASLRVFMATLRKKLEPTEESPQYIQTHIGVGYRMIKVE